MDCSETRVALSAGMDGEEPGVAQEQLDAHLAGCRACRAWAVDAAAVTRRVRVSPAEPAPDLSAAVLARLGPAPRRRRSGDRWARVALVLFGVVQVVVALRPFIMGPLDVAAHESREVATWEVALGVGFLFAAARPHLARGMVPLVAVFCVAVVVGGMADLTAGHTTVAAEALHLMAVAGSALLGVVARRHPIGPTSRATSRLGWATR